MRATARKIDEACRRGALVHVGGQKIWGAVAQRSPVPVKADKGKCWVNMADDISWRCVNIKDVTITQQGATNDIRGASRA